MREVKNSFVATKLLQYPEINDMLCAIFDKMDNKSTHNMVLYDRLTEALSDIITDISAYNLLNNSDFKQWLDNMLLKHVNNPEHDIVKELRKTQESLW